MAGDFTEITRGYFLKLILLSMATSVAFAIGNPHSVMAQDVPRVVVEGLDLLVAGQNRRAVVTWGRHWAGSDTAQIAAVLALLEDAGELLGKPHAYELVQTFEVGNSLQHLYMLVLYEKQPLFAHFIVYKPQVDWRVNAVRFSTDVAAVFPPSLVGPP